MSVVDGCCLLKTMKATDCEVLLAALHPSHRTALEAELEVDPEARYHMQPVAQPDSSTGARSESNNYLNMEYKIIISPPV